MSFSERAVDRNVKAMTRNKIVAARLVAMSADFLQIGLFPLFGEGFISPLNDALDVGVCLILTLLVGWHFAFLPSFVVELVPIADLVPTWTIAVFLATRQKQTGSAESQKENWSSVIVTENSPSAGSNSQKL